ncbi:hypothetical protein CDD83_288 [Cordyceps sp. RAO-2017]|nr:hypothetical protein CDD83_288 [Cordyceps sp. RAO-2017]
MLGLFGELGPSTIPGSDLRPVRNGQSWNNNASVIFLDQPVNTGFSHSGGDVTTTAAASRDVYALLTLFFHQFPQYAHQDFHIAGESYAGHYIPVFSDDILAHPDRNINLKSALIGNGLTDPLTQYRYYRPMACGGGGHEAVLDPAACADMDAALPECQRRIRACYDAPDDRAACAGATDFCNDAIFGPFERSGRDVYDIRRRRGDAPASPDYSAQFLNSRRVMDALGSEVDRFRSCNMQTNGNFVAAGDWMRPIHRVVPRLLERIPVLIYAGDVDFICNWLGNRAWADALDWPGRAAFANATRAPLRTAAGGQDYGNVKAARNFAFMQIYQAGHMVPADQPEAAADFFNRWLSGEWFAKP